MFYDKKKNQIDKKEVPYVMRYLGQFPSEAQVRDAILPEVIIYLNRRFKKINQMNQLNMRNSNLTC